MPSPITTTGRRALLTAAAAIVCTLVAITLVSSIDAQAAPSAWRSADLDGPSVPGGRGRTANDIDATGSAAVRFGGVPHVFYGDATGGDLRHAWLSGSQWNFETLDGDGTVNGRVDADVGVAPSALLYGGVPHVFHYDATNGDLRHTWWTGRVWLSETLDGNATTNGRRNADVGRDSSALLYGGVPHVFHRDDSNGDLRHGWWTGRAWAFETLDGDRSTGGRTTNRVGADSAVLLYGGAPHVFYRDTDAGDLRHTWWTGRGWAHETLDGDGTTGGRSDGDVGHAATTALFGTRPHVFHRDATAGTLRHTWWTGSRWAHELLDGPGSGGTGGRTPNAVGASQSLLVDAATIDVFHVDTTAQRLRRSWFAPSPPENTTPPTVSGTTLVGDTLSSGTGTWSNNPTSITRQWRRCDAGGMNCVDVAGRTAATYVLAEADLGATLRLRVTATNTAGSTSAESQESTTVVPRPPDVTSITPPSGPIAGASSVTITGTHLSTVTAVTFGTSAAMSFTVVSPTMIIAATPPGTTGSVDVTVSGPAGSDTLVAAFTYVPPPPTNTAAPTVTSEAGTHHPDDELGSTDGTWSYEPTSYARQWQRCDLAAVVCSDIDGATQQTYSVVADDLGARIRVAVTATNTGGATTATSDATPAVTTRPPAPTNSDRPEITGDSWPGSVVTATNGTWTDDPTSFAYQWQRCLTDWITCTELTGETAQTYTLTTDDLFSIIRVRVTATNAGGSASEQSWTFLYGYPQPAAVTSVSPSSGPDLGGTSVTITGERLGGVTSVYFGSGLGTSLAVVSDTEVRVVTPARSAGSVRLAISDGFNTVYVDNGFTYQPTPPVNTAAPTISGIVEVNETVSVSNGTWTKSPYNYAYRWLRCDAAGDDCEEIASATAATYKLVEADRFGTLRARVTATNAGGSTPFTTPATAVVPATPTIQQVAAGDSFSCARMSDGSVRCWGLNDYRQLGNGTANSSTALRVTGVTGVTQISAGLYHVCAVRSNGTVRCWGSGESVTSGTDSLTGVVEVASGSYHSCARLTDGTVRCWGSGSFGALGNGTQTSSSTPVVVSGLTDVTQIDAGSGHTCALLADQTVRCWGYGWWGQLGNGLGGNGTGSGASNSSVPVAVQNLTGVAEVSLGDISSCARLTDGTARCWGSNTWGQIGNGIVGDVNTPAVVSGLTDVVEIDAGFGYHTCARIIDGTARCWGSNGYRQLGTSPMSSSGTPVVVNGLADVAQMSAGNRHTCAVLADGTGRCWGSHLYGELGNGATPGFGAMTGVPQTVIGYS